MAIEAIKTDFGYMSELDFHPCKIAEEGFWDDRPKNYHSDKKKLFYVQYLHDAPILDEQLVKELNKLFLHVYFPQENPPEDPKDYSLIMFRNNSKRYCNCYNMSKVIVEYAEKEFSELNLSLLGNSHQIGFRLSDYPEEITRDPLKSKYMRYVPGFPHVIVHGSYASKSIAFDPLGIDILSPRESVQPLVQVFVANDNKTLNSILEHRYINITQSIWYQFKTQDRHVSAILKGQGTPLVTLK